MTILKSPWSKAVKIALIEHDMTQRKLARRIGCPESKLSGVINGSIIKPDIIEAVSSILQIDVPYSLPSVSDSSDIEG